MWDVCNWETVVPWNTILCKLLTHGPCHNALHSLSYSIAVARAPATRTACQFSVPVFDHKSGAKSPQKSDIIVTCIWSMTHSPMLSSHHHSQVWLWLVEIFGYILRTSGDIPPGSRLSTSIPPDRLDTSVVHAVCPSAVPWHSLWLCPSMPHLGYATAV